MTHKKLSSPMRTQTQRSSDGIIKLRGSCIISYAGVYGLLIGPTNLKITFHGPCLYQQANC